MFDFVHEKKRVVQGVLLLLILPFALWGVSSYKGSSGRGNVLATVDGEKVTQQDFDNAMRQQQNRMRQLMGANYDRAMFDQPEIKQSILNNLVNQRLLQSQAHAAGLVVTDDQLRQIIEGMADFQTDGKYDKQKYDRILAQQEMSGPMLEARIRNQVIMNQLIEAYSQNGYASAAAADNLIRLNEQQRVIRVAQISPDAFIKQVKVDDAAIKDYYDKNQHEFEVPEQARVEYVMFSVSALQAQESVSAEEIKQYYADHRSEFATPEQRKVAHIQIAVAPDAPEADKQAAQVKAEQILKQVKQDPAKFAELAKKYSDDAGSADNGGEVDFFSHGGLKMKSFEDAAFALKPGAISGLVRSDDGFHIIKLLAIKPGKVKPLAELRGMIVQQLKQQKANDTFAELADEFSNKVYEQSDSLKPAAELIKMPVRQSGWLSKDKAGEQPWTEKALEAVFSDEVLKEKRNSSAIEVAPNTLLAVRLLEHKPASTRSLSEVKAGIRAKLLHQQASELALKSGKEVLAALQHGDKSGVKWKAEQTITRVQRPGLEPELAHAVFRADIGKLPAYVGVESRNGGYALARIDAVKQAGAIDDAKRDRYLRQLHQLTGQELFKAYLADARAHAKVDMKAFQAEEKQ